MKSFEVTQADAKEGFEALTASSAALTKGYQAVATEVANFSMKSFEKYTGHWKKTVSTDSFDKIFEVQQGFAKETFDATIAEFTKLRELYAATARSAFMRYEVSVAAFGVKPIEASVASVNLKSYEASVAVTGVNPTEATGAVVNVEPIEASVASVEVKPYEATGAVVNVEPIEASVASVDVKPSEATGAVVSVEPVEARVASVDVKPYEATGAVVGVKARLKK